MEREGEEGAEGGSVRHALDRAVTASGARLSMRKVSAAERAEMAVVDALSALPPYFDPQPFPDAAAAAAPAPGEAVSLAGELAERGTPARPPALIREVLALPSAPGDEEGAEEAREAWALLARADEAAARGRTGEARELLASAYEVWDRAWMDRQTRARDALLAERSAAVEERRAALAAAQAEDEAANTQPEEGEEFAGYAAKRDREAAIAAAEQKRLAAADALEDAEHALNEAGERPSLDDRGRGAVEVTYEVMVLLRLGDAAMSGQRPRDALVAYWRAKESLDSLMRLRAAGAGGSGGDGAPSLLGHDSQLRLDALEFESVIDAGPGAGGTAAGGGGAAAAGSVHAHHLADPQPASGLVYSLLGAAAYHAGHWDQALRCFAVSKTMRLQSISGASTEFVDVATSVNNVGVVLHRMSRPFAALFWFESALEVLLTRLEAVHPRAETARNNAKQARLLVSRAEVAAGSAAACPAALQTQGKPVGAPQLCVRLTGLAADAHKAYEAGGGKSKGKKKKKGGKKKKKKK